MRYADRVNWVVARAEGQAADGMLVRDAVSIQSLDVDKLPGDADLRKQVSDVADHVRDLVKAPLGESFTGPVLFEPEAAAQLLAQMLGDNLYVPRKPMSDPGRNVNFLPSEFETKIGSRVLPEWMDVIDDPSQATWNGKPLAGYYQFDLEGVPPKPVAVIEKGILKSFLTTRQPVKGFAASNGHARLLGGYGASRAAIGNLFVKTSQVHAAGGSEKEADSDDAGSGQAVRPAGAEAELSLRRRLPAICRRWHRPASNPAARRGR